MGLRWPFAAKGTDSGAGPVNGDLPAKEASAKAPAITLGLILFGLLVAALYWNFLAPVRRAPEAPNGKVQQQKVQKTVALQQFASFVSRMNERRQ